MKYRTTEKVILNTGLILAFIFVWILLIPFIVANSLLRAVQVTWGIVNGE